MNWKQQLALRYIRARLHILTLVSPQKAAKKAFALFCTPRRKKTTRMPPLFEKAEKLSFRLDDHTIRGHRWQPHPSKDLHKKVLITHGFESNIRNFEHYVKALLEKGYEVLAFDAPAHGQSGGKRITLPLYTEMIRTIFDRFGPVHSFMGHSLGALSLALFLDSIRHDEQVRLVLIAPVVEASAAVDMFFQLLELDGEVRAAFEAHELSLFGLPFSWFSLRRALVNIKARVLYVQDEDDTVTPLKDALTLQDAGYPHVRFLITKGLGHRKIYRDKDVARQVVAFL